MSTLTDLGILRHYQNALTNWNYKTYVVFS